MSQQKYSLDLLANTILLGGKPCEIPMVLNVKLTIQNVNEFPNFERYRKMVSNLNYLIVTYPKNAFLMSMLSQIMTSPRTSYQNVMLGILHYLKRAPRHGILYSNYGYYKLEGICDAN